MTAATETPARRGPRPLLLHLTLAMLRSNVSLATSTPLSAGFSNSSALEAIRSALRDGGAEAAFPKAVLDETLRRDGALIAGIAAYRRHPWRRTLSEPPALWSEGGSRLLDYGGNGPVVLVIPSLVNRSWVLDLMDGHSMLRWLAAHGVRPLLLDWGWPGETERRFTLTDYVAGRLERAMAEAARLSGGAIRIAGYCMGGTLAVAAATRRPDLVSGMALLATPWDFHAGDPRQPRQAADCLPLLEPLLAFNGTLPVDTLQALFTLLDPWGVAEKYRAFTRLDPAGGRARLFVALEDWLNDGIPLAAPVARECLAGWYGENTPARGAWRIAGQAVDPSVIDRPAFVAIPARDRIVPPGSASALAERITGAVVHRPAAGHIGMVAGGRAESALWQPLLDWLGTPGARDQRRARRRRRT
jgi:polyhydroxyalkanoate synthase subunit PhaC